MKKQFNITKLVGVDWARFSWNPVTGCLTNCKYCYARGIAERFPDNFGGRESPFRPKFHPDRLLAPQCTKPISGPGGNLVFVCSMGEMFGDWVPQEWIDAVLEQVRKNPQWTFLFLTKNPERLTTIEWPVNVWVGATVDCQARVKPTTDAMKNVKASVRFISAEPLLERVDFGHDLKHIDWLIIGGQTGRTPVIPSEDWVNLLAKQARDAGCKLYFKHNLGMGGPTELPCRN